MSVYSYNCSAESLSLLQDVPQCMRPKRLLRELAGLGVGMTDANDGNESASGAYPAQYASPSVFELVKYPLLSSIDPKYIISFMEARQAYELEVEEKKRQNPNMEAARFKVCVKPSVLRAMHFMDMFEAVARDVELKDLTSEHIRESLEIIVNESCRKEPSARVIEAALQCLKMPMYIEDPKMRVRQLVLQYLEIMENIGHRSFKEDNPKMTVTHITEALYPPRLWELVEKDLEYRPKLKKDVQAFIKFVEEQAEHVDKVRSWNITGKNGKPKTKDSNDKKKGSSGVNAGFYKSSGKDNNRTITKRPPLCLYSKCRKDNKYHFLRNCTECTDPEERKRLLNEFRAEQKGKTRILKDKERNVEDSTTLMKATFAETLTKVLCADSGSDVNLIGPKDLAALLSSGAEVKVKKFHAPRQYQMAAEEDIDDNKVFVECDRAVRLDTRLHVRHAVGINLRNCTWMVSTQDVKEPLLGWQVLESLGLDIKQVLLAACDKFNGEVDISKLLPEEEDISGSVARICNQGIFHGHAAAEEDAALSEDDSLFVSIGDDKPEEIDTAFRELLKEAQTEGMSDESWEQLRNMLNEYRDIFRIKLGRDPAAKVEPMQLNLKPNSKPIIAKARRYSTPQRVFISTFTTKLEEYGYIKQNKNAKWAAAPLLVPKPPPVNYRLTFDYRPVNAVTETIPWPMPHIESELSDTADSSAFAKLDFCNAYWQLPLDEDGQEALSFTTPKGIMKPMRTPQGGKIALPVFRPKLNHALQR